MSSAKDFADLTDNVKKGLAALSVSRDPNASKKPLRPFDWYMNKVSQKDDLTIKEAEEAFTQIFFGNVDEEKVGVFLMLQRNKGATPVEVAGMARAIRAQKIHTIGDVMEISGKEDPGKSTFCVNTAATVLAAACGCKVANVTRKSMLESNKIFKELEVALDLGALQAMTSLDKCGIAYVRDPKTYPKTSRLASVQKRMGVGTSIDLLGQMSYIPGTKSGLVIMNGKTYSQLMLKVIEELGHMERAVVVCVESGSNEITPQGPFHVYEIENDAPPGAEKDYKSKSWEFDPASVNIARSRTGDLFSFGDADEFCAVLAPGAVSSPKRDSVVLTAGLACYAFGITYSIEDGIAMARKKLESGKCIQVLQFWLKASISARRAE